MHLGLSSVRVAGSSTVVLEPATRKFITAFTTARHLSLS